MQYEEMLESGKLYLKKIKKFLSNPPVFTDNSDEVRLSFIRRIYLGIESSRSLIKKGYYYDAHLIAGSLIEALAMLDYILSENKVNEYNAFGSVMLIKKSLLIQLTGMIKNYKISKNELRILKQQTKFFLKPKKDMDELIAFLSNKKISPEEKLNKIKDCYNFFSYPERNVREYVDKTENITLKLAYDVYCDLKHYNSAAFDYVLSSSPGYIRQYSEEYLKGQAISLTVLIMFHTNQMIQQWLYELEG